jgi:hypothetical protein
VTVYRRKTPNGNLAFIVANYADGKRRFDSYLAEAEALDAAHTLAKQIDKRDYVAASTTQGQAVEYADSVVDTNTRCCGDWECPFPQMGKSPSGWPSRVSAKSRSR